MALILVRHGESEGNASRIVQGWHDLPLSTLGRAQAAATSRRLAGEPIVAVYGSPLIRAYETASLIAAPHGLAVVERAELREYGWGEAQGLRWDEVDARWPHDAEEWGVGHIPGEEGGFAFHDRVTPAFDDLAARHRDELAVLVAHGGTIVQILSHVLGLPSGQRVRAAVANCALTIVATGEGDLHVVRVLNDACHLQDVTLAE